MFKRKPTIGGSFPAAVDAGSPTLAFVPRWDRRSNNAVGTRWAATGAAAIACALMLTPAPAAAATSTQAPARDAGTLAQKAPAVALTADEVVTRSSGTQSSSRFLRDAQGRTRVESGSTVTINDPTTKSTLRLDLRNQTFTRTANADRAPAADGKARSADASSDKSLTSTSTELGTAMVNGVRAEGRRYTVTTSRPETATVSRQVTVWIATDLELAVKTHVVEPDGSSYTQSYTNIRTGTALAADLFAVPAGFRAAAPRPTGTANGTAGAGTNASCPLNLFPSDPLLLTSIGLFFAVGIVAAETDGAQNCFFAADAGVFQYPMWGYPITPLFLPSDQWFVYDTGLGCLPFYPYVAFGDIAFAAASDSDQTVKDNLVVLTIFP